MSSGALTTCQRCGDLVRVKPARDNDAKMLKRAKTAEGYCLPCAVAEWFVAMDLRGLVEDPASLLLPHVQAQFATIMASSGTIAKPTEIEWKHVVAHWSLPFVTTKSGKRTSFPVGGEDELSRMRQRKARGS